VSSYLPKAVIAAIASKNWESAIAAKSKWIAVSWDWNWKVSWSSDWGNEDINTLN
jgi:hypothetical protein